MMAFIKNSSVARNSTQDLEENTMIEQNQIVWFGVLPKDNPIIAYERYQPLVNYLTEATGIQTELHLEKTYQEVVNSLGKGKIGFALLGPLTYLDARKRFNRKNRQPGAFSPQV
jgi:ABC-type phosphate/phosphonate transport system substrate-binding protein